MIAADMRTAMRWRAADGSAREEPRTVPLEAAIGLAYDSRPYVVVIGSPADLEDLAVGFTVTERIARAPDIERVSVSAAPAGFAVDILLRPAAARGMALARRRTLEARSSCGLCGVETLKEAIRPVARVGEGLVATPSAIQRALTELEAGQSLGRETRATHAAAWAAPSGAVQLVREDVGRHNALDKVIGAGRRAGLDPARAFLVVTSRCSYEMVDKAAAAGIAMLVAISAPTALAIERADEAGLTLIALARADGHSVFTGGHRVQAH